MAIVVKAYLEENCDFNEVFQVERVVWLILFWGIETIFLIDQDLVGMQKEWYTCVWDL